MRFLFTQNYPEKLTNALIAIILCNLMTQIISPGLPSHYLTYENGSLCNIKKKLDLMILIKDNISKLFKFQRKRRTLVWRS